MSSAFGRHSSRGNVTRPSRSPESPKQVCPHFLKGTCMFGDSCRLLHSRSARSDLESSSFKAPHSALGPCKFFSQGRCTKDASCPFPHFYTGQNAIATAPDENNHDNPNIPVFGPCKFYVQGSCSKGSACPFVHPIQNPPADKITKNPIPCTFFAKGICKKGDDCPFVHLHHPSTVVSPIPRVVLPDTTIVLNDTVATAISQRNEPNEASKDTVSSGNDKKNSTQDDETCDRNMLRCKVSFGSGASVLSVTTSFESRSILLSNLPPHVTQLELINLLDPFGHLETILSDNSNTACGKFDSISEAAAAVQGLHKTLFKDRRILAKMDLKSVESGEVILRSTKVKVSWYAPGRIAWAHYRTIYEARNQAQRLNGLSFNDKPVLASFQIPSSRQKTSFSVELKGLHAQLDIAHLRSFCQTKSVTLGTPFYTRQSSLRYVEALLRKYGSLDTFEALPADDKQPKITAFAQFADGEQAAESVKQLHNKSQAFLHNAPVWLENIHSFKYTIPFPHFSVIKTSLFRLRDDCKDCKLRFYDKDETGQTVEVVCIRVFGTDPKSLGQVKAELDVLLRGENLLDESGKAIWDDFLVVGAGKTFLANVGKDTNTFIQCDPRTRTIRISGENNEIRSSVHMIRQRIHALGTEKHIFNLDKGMVKALMRGGLEKLQQITGIDKLVFDVVARTLIVRSHASDVERVKLTLASYDSQLPSTNPPADATCPVCYCEVTDEARLSCGHLYCKDCLQHLLQAAADSTSPSAKCVFEISDRPCNTPISNTLIRTLLSPDQEDRLYEASFLAYIHSRPSEFKYCPTPDCRVVYRPADAILRCPSCFDRTCASCHVLFHEGLTCDEHRDNTNGGIDAFRRWKEANDVRSCPKCQADLQKNGGCNHMHCIRCDVHICWACMKTFKASEVYKHMRSAHGGS